MTSPSRSSRRRSALSTTSRSSSAVEGSVNVAGATTLELQYPDGTTTPVALAADGTFRLDIPAERQADFATAWGQLVARDADGTIVAATSFSSVANEMRES